MVGVQVGAVATAENQSFSGEKTAFGIDSQIDGNSIFPALIMSVLQRLFADRKEFAFIVGRSRRLGKPAYFRRPEQILLTGTQAGYIRFDFFVSLYGKAFFEIFISTNRGIVIFLSPFRIGGHVYQTFQDTCLQLTCMFGVQFDFFQAGGEVYFIQKFCNIHRSYRNLFKCAKLILFIGISIFFLFFFYLYVRIGEKNRNLN